MQKINLKEWSLLIQISAFPYIFFFINLPVWLLISPHVADDVGKSHDVVFSQRKRLNFRQFALDLNVRDDGSQLLCVGEQVETAEQVEEEGGKTERTKERMKERKKESTNKTNEKPRRLMAAWWRRAKLPRKPHWGCACADVLVHCSPISDGCVPGQTYRDVSSSAPRWRSSN